MCALLEIQRGGRTQEFVLYKEESGTQFSGQTCPDMALKAMKYINFFPSSQKIHILALLPLLYYHNEVICNTHGYTISYSTMFHRVIQSKMPS